MALDRDPAVELGRRVAAARKYRGVSQVALAKRLRIGPDTLGRWERGSTDKDYKRDAMIDAAVRETKLPQEFFVIDFSDLPAMVQRWRQVGSPQWSPKLDAELGAAELESELEQGAQRSESNGNHIEESEPESESQ